MTHDKKIKQALGIFYTREDIVNFIYDIILLWKEREDKEQKRWEAHKPKHYPSVIDPACGEGIFLKKAVEKGFTKPDWIFGMDIDESVVNKWPEISLLEAFEGDAEKLKAHFLHQNGLKRIQWNQHKKQYYGKLKKADIENEQFNLVIGNPPYGGMGLETEEFSDELIVQLENYKILPEEIKKEIAFKSKHYSLFSFSEGNSKSINQKIKDRLKSFPIEVLFIDRFIQLAKPGGWIAIVIPDGILSNSNLHYVRQYIADNAKIEAIVSLPRDAFKHVGTSAKTSILFLKKQKTDNLNYPVFLASLEKIVPPPLAGEGQGEGGFLTEILSQYKEFYMKQTLSKDKKVYSNDFMMVRVDKTLKEMMEVLPSSRWDSGYWEPRHEVSSSIVENNKFRPLINYIDFSICGYRGKTEFKTTGIPCIEALCVLASGTGIDISLGRHVPIRGKGDKPDKRTQVNDLLFVRSGVGCAGRTAIVSDSAKNYVLGGHVYKVVLKNIEPAVVHIWLKTSIGQNVMNRLKAGVGALVLDEGDIKALPIPELPQKIQSHIQSAYNKMAAFHDKAMAAKEKKDEAGFKKNIETAEAMLKDLIAKTEAVIRGEREDVG